MRVASQFPKLDPGQHRLAVIGQSPGQREVEQGRPFCGPSGDQLDAILGHAGISREMVFIGNVAQVKPPKHKSGADFNSFEWDGPEVQEGIAQLRKDLEAYKPTMVLCLGNEALHLFKAGNMAPPRQKKQGAYVHVWPHAISSWRGSLFESHFLLAQWPSNNGFQAGPMVPQQRGEFGSRRQGIKCIATYHPAALLREPDLQPYVKVDVKRCAQELAAGPQLVLPQRNIVIYKEFGDALGAIRLAKLQQGRLVSIDSEGYCSGMTVFGWSFDLASAGVIPFVDEQGERTFTLEEEVLLLEEIKAWMEDPAVPKVLQNYLSDAFVLAWTYGIVIQGLAHDTMCLAWEAECELDKGLATLASLYTREPHWKTKENYRDRLAWVCGVDAAVTMEVAQVLLRKVYGPEAIKQNSAAGGMSKGNQGDQHGVEGTYAGNGCTAEDVGGVGTVAGYAELSAFKWLRRPQDHYEFNLSLLPSLLYMELRGMRFDKEKAKAMMQVVQEEIYEVQHEINLSANKGVSPLGEMLAIATKSFCRKNPKEKQEVVEERWQPMRHNGKKWVKNGKQLCYRPPPYDYIEQDKEPAASSDQWLKPVPKTVKRSVPTTITTWDQLERHCKPKCKPKLQRVKEILHEIDQIKGCEPQARDQHTTGQTDLQRAPASPRPRPRSAILGELSVLLGTAVNVNSTGKGGDCQWLLYECWGLDKKFKKGAKASYDEAEVGFHSDGTSGEGSGLTSDDEALLSLYLKAQDPRLKLILRMRQLVKEMSYLRTATDADGRVRTGLNLVATPTGRMASYSSPTGSSRLNMQTITKRLRCLFPADEGHTMLQRDLSGADGWTVAAHCAALGDQTMLNDFLARLKPQSILALIYKLGPEVNNAPYDVLRTMSKEHVDEASWQYMAFKRVFHLSDYDGQPKKMSESILTDSWKKGGEPIYVSPQTCEDMQQKAFHVRYVGVRAWHEMWRKRFLTQPVVALETSFGHRHVFHGRKREWVKAKRCWKACGETHRYALACEPQLNTTHILKRALWRLWYDPQNRSTEGGLRVEPLIPVHDSLLQQSQDVVFMEAKAKEWYDNGLIIAGIEVMIPASSEVGKDWSMKA